MNKIIFPIFLILFFLQFSFFPMFFHSGINFNLLLVLAVVLVKQFSFRHLFLWIFLIGIGYDYFSSQALGVGILTFLLIGFFIDFIQKKVSISERSIFFSIVFYIFAKLIFDYLIILITKIFVFFGVGETSQNVLKIISTNYLWEMIGFVVACLVLSKFFNKIKNLNSTNLKLEKQ